MFFTKRKPRAPTSPIQRLCGLAFAICIFFQAPLLTLPVRRNEHVFDEPLSALEIASIGVLAYQEQFADATQAVLLPGVWWKLASKQAFACLSRSMACAPKELLDTKALVQACDYAHLVQPFLEVTGAAAGMLAVASGMIVSCAVAMPVVPDLTVAVVAMGLFVWSVLQTPCTPLPTLAFVGLLCLFAVFGKEAQKPAAGQRTAAVAGAGRARAVREVVDARRTPQTPKKRVK